VLAVADATVVDVRDEETVTGIATANLFRWNSVMLKVDTKENDEGGDLYVEYVHVAAKSAIVAVGDVVRRGQKICESGSVGFSPEPHLHFTAFRSRDPRGADRARAGSPRKKNKNETGEEGWPRATASRTRRSSKDKS